MKSSITAMSMSLDSSGVAGRSCRSSVNTFTSPQCAHTVKSPGAGSPPTCRFKSTRQSSPAHLGIGILPHDIQLPATLAPAIITRARSPPYRFQPHAEPQARHEHHRQNRRPPLHENPQPLALHHAPPRTSPPASTSPGPSPGPRSRSPPCPGAPRRSSSTTKIHPLRCRRPAHRHQANGISRLDENPHRRLPPADGPAAQHRRPVFAEEPIRDPVNLPAHLHHLVKVESGNHAPLHPALALAHAPSSRSAAARNACAIFGKSSSG